MVGTRGKKRGGETAAVSDVDHFLESFVKLVRSQARAKKPLQVCVRMCR